MQNNSHMEESMKRLQRFQNGPPSEIIDTFVEQKPILLENKLQVAVTL